MCAVSDEEVGVDIQAEVSPEKAEKIACRFFAPDERAQSERFTELWAKKEAYIKFTGMGLSAMMSVFSVLGELPSCHIYGGSIKNCRYAVCTPDETAPKAVFVSQEELLRGIYVF